MIKFFKKYSVGIISVILLLVSALGMLVLKHRIEQEVEQEIYEFYFTSFQFVFFGTLLYLVATWLFKSWSEYQTLKNDKTKAELLNLRNQINPHFFFNTLNNLYGLIKKDTAKSQEFVLKLSELMRYSIYGTNNGRVGILEEVEYLKSYIDLHTMRYFKTVEVNFEENIKDYNFKIHPLLLIILVENAFKHGVEKLTDHAFVNITLFVDQNKLIFRVENNFDGNGQPNETGIGLKNLQLRLKLLYPKKHSLTTFEEGNKFDAYLELLA